MATKDELKEYIKGRVKTNTNKEITGNSLQTVLCRMVDELDLNDSCQVVLIRYTNGPTTFGDLKKLYDANKAVVVQFGEGYNILITQVSSTAFTGYRFNLNSGSTDGDGLGIVSMTATRYNFTEEGLTLDNFTVSSNGGSGGDQPASLTWAYSDYEGEGTPPDPDTDPSLWYAAKKDSSVWAALKEEGGAWNIWRLKPYTGKDGRGIKTTQVSYVLSDQGITPPTTGWNINMPNIEVGKYLWSRTIITYTDDTTSTIYSVTYIGKDGNDGKNGTSVTIKGTLESIDDLPTDPKPTPGDGYIINGNLWTYTGTTLENDENHKGFTNVGPIKGDQGNSACLHIAWTNSLAPDWTNFTTQKPSGQKFKYMGTYVDYSADPSTCIDSQNPTDYHWQDVSGENGESVIVADLDNEIESIALDYEGKTTEALAFTPVVSMWYGLTKLTLDSLTAKVVGSIYYRNVTTNPDVSTGTVTVSLPGGILITSFQVEITAKATVRGQSYIKQVVFSVNCVKAGAPGEDVTLYSLQPSVSAIHKDKNGNIDPVSITCKKLKTVGSTQGETQDGVLKYKIDNGSLLNYSGAIDCSLISSKIRFEYSVGGVLWDAEDVFVIRDGKDGDGESAIYADLDNEMIAAQVDYDGVTTLQQTWSTKFSIWSGTAKQTLTSLTVNSPDPLTSSVDKSTGVVTMQAAKGVTLQTKYEIEITGTAVVNGETLTRKATLVLICPRPGQPGEDTLIYQVKPSETVISKHKDGTYSANSITCQVIVIQGSESAIADLTVLKNAYIYYYTDGSSTKKTYSRALVPGTDFTSSVKFQFVIDNFLWDTETVLIIEDGKDGDDGDTPYIVDSKTKTEYAITTNTEIPTSWSPNPIEGIPGQYLWIRITYTWSNDSTTVSLSYSRCGSDGSSGTSKATVVNYQGPWKADGLYTGMEDDTTIRVDVVYYQGTGESDGKYYLAIQSKQFIDQTTPAPNTAEGKAYWGAFQGQFANIATGLLFTETAVIENAIVRVLQTGSEGARIETEGNKMSVYDKDNIQRVLIDPGSSSPFTSLDDHITQIVDQLGVMIPITSLYGQNYTGGTLKVVSYDSKDSWDDKVVQADALMIALVTGDTYDHVYGILNDDGNNGIIPISSGNSEDIILYYIEKHLNSDLVIWTIETGNTETINYDPIRVGFDEESIDRIISQGGTGVGDITLLPDWVIGGEKASLKHSGAEQPSVVVSPKDRYNFPGSTVLVSYSANISEADCLEFGPTPSSKPHLSEISGLEGELSFHLVLKNKSRNTECIFMSLTGDYPINIRDLLEQTETLSKFPQTISSGDSKTEVREAIPELICGVYEIALRITVKIDAKGTGWNTLSVPGLEFLFHLGSSSNNVLTHPRLILNSFDQGQSIKIYSSGISVVKSAREYFQLSIKDLNDQGDSGLDLEILAQEHLFKINAEECFMGPVDIYNPSIQHYHSRPGYGVVDISIYGTSVNSIPYTLKEVAALIELVKYYPIYLHTVFGVAPLVVTYNPRYTGYVDSGLCASFLSVQVDDSGQWITVRHDFWLSNSTCKFNYQQVTL